MRDEKPEIRQTSRGCLFWGLRLGLGIPLGLLLLLVLVFVGRERSANIRLQKQIAHLRSQGVPVDFKSLELYHESLTSDKNTQAWIEALNVVTSKEFHESAIGIAHVGAPRPNSQSEAEIPDPGADWGDEKAVREFLQKWRSVHQRIRQLSLQQLEPEAVPVRLPLKFDFTSVLTYQQKMRQAARLLRLRGQVAIYDRASPETRSSIEALLGCSEVLSGEPTLISQLISVAINGIAIGQLQSALAADVLGQSLSPSLRMKLS
jgi:hypothetical protein